MLAIDFARGTNLKARLDTILNNPWRNRRRDAGRARVDDNSDTEMTCQRIESLLPPFVDGAAAADQVASRGISIPD